MLEQDWQKREAQLRRKKKRRDAEWRDLIASTTHDEKVEMLADRIEDLCSDSATAETRHELRKLLHELLPTPENTNE